MTIRRAIILFFCFIPLLLHAQKDILVLQKRGTHVASYTVGDQLVFKTVYGQWLNGTIEDLYHDSIYIIGQVFSYHEISALRKKLSATKSNNGALGTLMMTAGGGFLVIGAVNGLLRKDAPKEWYTTSGYVIGGVLLAGGYLLSRSGNKDYNLGGKYRLEYLQISKERFRR